MRFESTSGHLEKLYGPFASDRRVDKRFVVSGPKLIWSSVWAGLSLSVAPISGRGGTGGETGASRAYRSSGAASCAPAQVGPTPIEVLAECRAGRRIRITALASGSASESGGGSCPAAFSAAAASRLKASAPDGPSAWCLAESADLRLSRCVDASHDSARLGIS